MLVRRKWTDKERQYLTVDSLLQNRRSLKRRRLLMLEPRAFSVIACCLAGICLNESSQMTTQYAQTAEKLSR